MLFNSYEFLLVFLPIVFSTYFLLNKYAGFSIGKFFLLLASVAFYCYWNPVYFFLLAFTIGFNFYVGRILSTHTGSQQRKKAILAFGLTVNLGMLAFFKYFNFFIDNINTVFDTHIAFWKIVLPLGISFITFQKIGFLVDAYHRKADEINLVNYGLFAAFFPQLIAGPIVHHSEILPQFNKEQNKRLNYENILRGGLMVMFGIIKKVLVADVFANWANKGFDATQTLNLAEAWITSLSYTFQLYYDFSGYSDMAIGLGLMFNIKIPFNFNTPYKATGISDFWRRWHMTLSRFLRDYIYIPLGGNQVSFGRNAYNLMAVFLIGGIWHGAAWTFVFWGFLHGAASVVERLFKQTGIKLHRFISWFITFNFVNIAWIFFRANTWADSIKVLKGMFGMSSIVLPETLQRLSFLKRVDAISFGEWNRQISERTYYSNRIGLYLLIFSFLAVRFRNSQEMFLEGKINMVQIAIMLVLFLYSLLLLGNNPQFLYFNF